MSEAQSLFAILRQSADADVVAALERLVRDGEARSGDTALLVAFGAGLAYAAQVVTLP